MEMTSRFIRVRAPTRPRQDRPHGGTRANANWAAAVPTTDRRRPRAGGVIRDQHKSPARKAPVGTVAIASEAQARNRWTNGAAAAPPRRPRTERLSSRPQARKRE